MKAVDDLRRQAGGLGRAFVTSQTMIQLAKLIRAHGLGRLASQLG